MPGGRNNSCQPSLAGRGKNKFPKIASRPRAHISSTSHIGRRDPVLGAIAREKPLNHWHYFFFMRDTGKVASILQPDKARMRYCLRRKFS
jgi:hypothetical protein